MKYLVWTMLLWIDNNINHKIIDRIFDIFPLKEDGFDFWYWLWLHTSRKFCNWVILDLEDADWNRRK